MAGAYEQLIELGNDEKLIAVAEVGRVPDPELELAYETDWLYFCTWGDTYINNEEQNPLAFLKKVRFSSCFFPS
jgi:mannan endo-1,4-beta-mannosidase